ncbi:hypothetical protein MMPV_008198 [Pyropia vietnamensis]
MLPADAAALARAMEDAVAESDLEEESGDGAAEAALLVATAAAQAGREARERTATAAVGDALEAVLGTGLLLAGGVGGLDAGMEAAASMMGARFLSDPARGVKGDGSKDGECQRNDAAPKGGKAVAKEDNDDGAADGDTNDAAGAPIRVPAGATGAPNGTANVTADPTGVTDQSAAAKGEPPLAKDAPFIEIDNSPLTSEAAAADAAYHAYVAGRAGVPSPPPEPRLLPLTVRLPPLKPGAAPVSLSLQWRLGEPDDTPEGVAAMLGAVHRLPASAVAAVAGQVRAAVLAAGVVVPPPPPPPAATAVLPACAVAPAGAPGATSGGGGEEHRQQLRLRYPSARGGDPPDCGGAQSAVLDEVLEWDLGAGNANSPAYFAAVTAADVGLPERAAQVMAAALTAQLVEAHAAAFLPPLYGSSAGTEGAPVTDGPSALGASAPFPSVAGLPPLTSSLRVLTPEAAAAEDHIAATRTCAALVGLIVDVGVPAAAAARRAAAAAAADDDDNDADNDADTPNNGGSSDEVMPATPADPSDVDPPLVAAPPPPSVAAAATTDASDDEAEANPSGGSGGRLRRRHRRQAIVAPRPAGAPSLDVLASRRDGRMPTGKRKVGLGLRKKKGARWTVGGSGSRKRRRGNGADEEGTATAAASATAATASGVDGDGEACTTTDGGAATAMDMDVPEGASEEGGSPMEVDATAGSAAGIDAAGGGSGDGSGIGSAGAGADAEDGVRLRRVRRVLIKLPSVASAAPASVGDSDGSGAAPGGITSPVVVNASPAEHATVAWPTVVDDDPDHAAAVGAAPTTTPSMAAAAAGDNDGEPLATTTAGEPAVSLGAPPTAMATAAPAPSADDEELLEEEELDGTPIVDAGTTPGVFDPPANVCPSDAATPVGGAPTTTTTAVTAAAVTAGTAAAVTAAANGVDEGTRPGDGGADGTDGAPSHEGGGSGNDGNGGGDSSASPPSMSSSDSDASAVEGGDDGGDGGGGGGGGSRRRAPRAQSPPPARATRSARKRRGW